MSHSAGLSRLLPKILPDVELDIALYRGEFVAVSALMEHRGVPVDMQIFPLLVDPQTWRLVRDTMVPVIDAQYGVYVQGGTGDWSFNAEKFGEDLEREGIAWPRTETGKLGLRRKTFEGMSKGHP